MCVRSRAHVVFQAFFLVGDAFWMFLEVSYAFLEADL